MDGGDRIAEILQVHGVPFVFALCGGHISPVLVGCKRRGIRVVDVRHEVTAVFAADAVARLTGKPGVAAVTAGPGATNTVTAIENARLAQSPIVLLVGATATALKGRGALQDIDQKALLGPHVKWGASARRVRDLAPLVHRAFAVARSGVPGPVCVECPVDLLYPETVVREWYGGRSKAGGSLSDRVVRFLLGRHVDRIFAGADAGVPPKPRPVPAMHPRPSALRRAASRLALAERPVLLVGSQALLEAPESDAIADAVARLNLPVYLSGMARGLLGRVPPLQIRHGKKRALRESDLVVLAGVPCDFRLDYGRPIAARTPVIAANRSRRDLRLNRRPALALRCDAGRFLQGLADELAVEPERWREWRERLHDRDRERDEEIRRKSETTGATVNPLRLCREIESAAGSDSVIVADGGDFVGTAARIIRPRGPLSWLDPGVFGTLGVGAGFALGARLCRPDSEVWILYGDGSLGYSLSEFDTFVRHRVPVIAVVGNDACWAQIARDQVRLLGDDVGCGLLRTDYHRAAEGLGGRGYLLRDADRVAELLRQARIVAGDGRPVLVNVHIDRTDFREGSVSI